MAKCVLITGVHTGIGHELADEYLSDGWTVYALSRKLPDDLKGRDGFHFEAIDLSRHEEIAGVLKRLLAEAGVLNLVVLNAGVLGVMKDFKDTSMDEITALMDVNVWANKFLIDGLLDLGLPIKQIVGVSSGASHLGSGGFGPYALSKAALNLLLRVYAHEHPKIHMTSMAPGVVDTGMIQYILAQEKDARYDLQERIRGLVGTPDLMDARTAAIKFKNAVPKLLARPSGEYVRVTEFD